MNRITLGEEKLIAGVCSGIAKYFDLDPVIVRLIVVILAIFSLGTIVIAYIIAWIIIPSKTKLKKKK